MMPLTIDLAPQSQQWIEREAEKRGVTPNDYAASLIIKQIDDPASLPYEELMLRQFESLEMSRAYLAAAEARLAQMTPEEIAAEEAEDQDFINSLNGWRRLQGMEPLTQ